MSKNNSIEFYREVPKEQRRLFFDFRADHPFKMIQYRNKNMEYLSTGEGEKVLLFLHGALVGPEMWFYPILQLKGNYRIISPLFIPQMMGAEEAAGFVQAILSKENISKATVIGYSYGGGLAQYLAEINPRLVEKLVLTHTGLAGRESAKREILKTKIIVSLLPFTLMKKGLGKRIAYFQSSNWNEFHRAFFLEAVSTLTKKDFTDYLDSMIRFTSETEILNTNKREWQGETVLMGTPDDEDAFKYLEQLGELYPQARRYIFENDGGHHMIFLFPEVFTQVLLKYLELEKYNDN